MNHKLGVIVPYRNRPKQLKEFKEYISNYLYSKKIHHEVIIVEQDDDASFNRGLLLNWGCRKAEWAGCDYVVFHDIDMLPVDVDYSYSEVPVHLVTDTGNKKLNKNLFYDYFGGVTLFPLEVFKKINGFSNDYWGWGFEDDDLFLRCQENNLKTDYLKIKQRRHSGIGLKLDGKKSFITVDNPIKLKRSFTIFGSFTTTGIDCNIDYEYDEMNLFSFPGPDIGLTYRSFMNFNFQLWDQYLNSHSIFTKKYPLGSYNYCCTFDLKGDTKKVSLYINGDLIGEKTLDSLLELDQKHKRVIYIGVGDPVRETKPNYFKGLINNFAIYEGVLTKDSIAEISKNTKFSLFEFKSSSDLLLYFDSKFIQDNKFVDLVGNNRSLIKNCSKVDISELTEQHIPIPIRRQGKFKVTPHKSSGFTDSWNDWSSRKNQMKYFELLKKNKTNSSKDGISEYWGKLVKETSDFNKHHLYVTT